MKSLLKGFDEHMKKAGYIKVKGQYFTEAELKTRIKVEREVLAEVEQLEKSYYKAKGVKVEKI